MNIFEKYPKPWRVERVAEEDGLFSYEIRSAGFDLITIINEEDFVDDDEPENGILDARQNIGDALALAMAIVTAIGSGS